MVIKRKDFQKAAAFIHEFLLKLNEDGECAELRDTLNLALLHMQKYYRILQSRSHEKNAHNTLQVTARGLSPMTPFVDTPDKFQWKWHSMDSFTRLASTMSVEDSTNFVKLPPIIQAAMDGDLDQIEQLIKENPVYANDQDGIGRTALTYAVHFNQPEAVNCLLENQVDVNLCAHDGSTALHLACYDGNQTALSLMLDFQGDLSIQDTHGRAPVHWAVTTLSLDCLALLLEHNVDVGVRDKDGLSASMWACRMDNIQHFELLSRADTSHVDEHDGFERDGNGRTWMHWAVRRSEPLECLQTLLTADTACMKDDDGKTVLLLAAEMGSLLAAKLILEIAGHRRLNDVDNQGRSALHLATIRGHGDIVNYLLEQGVDLTIVDTFNATAWDYARNRQLHYCQLILMSHQRQRLTSNPATPITQGMGLIGDMPYMNGDVQHTQDFRNWRNNKSPSTTPVTPPHPPKRPRTSRGLARRANSLTLSDSQEKIDMSGDRVVSSAGNERKKERIEVSVDTRRAANNAFSYHGRDETDMVTDEQDGGGGGEEDVEEVSVGGMDVSDMEDDEDRPPPTARPAPAPRPQVIQPRPPPRHTQPCPSPPTHSKSIELNKDDSGRYQDQDETTTTTTILDTGYKQRQTAPQVQTPAYRSGRAGPAPSPPNITPQRPHMIRQQQPLPPRPAPREPPGQRPGSGPSSSRDQVVSPPPLSSGSEQGSGMKKPLSPDTGNRQDTLRHESNRQDMYRQDGNRPDNTRQDSNRPGSGGQTKPPGVLEGRRIPPPMLTPLPNAPKVPSLIRINKIEKKKKKKRRDRDKDREQNTKSPPEVQNQQNPLDIPPPRGFAAPLHPFPQERVRSAAPSQPRHSKGIPQHHDSRYVEESEDPKGVQINGHAVPMREAPARSARPGPRLQPMEEEESPYNESGGDNPIQPSIAEEEDVGPLIPPPQAFRSGGRFSSASQLSQSVPQDNYSSARMMPTSAKPPLPRGRSSAGMSGRTSRNSNTRSSISRRTPRPPTSRSESNS